MKVSIEKLRELCVNLGWKAAGTWDAKKLKAAIAKMEAVGPAKLEEADEVKLFKQLIKAKPTDVEIEEEEESEEDDSDDEEEDTAEQSDDSEGGDESEDDEEEEEEKPKGKKADKPSAKKRMGGPAAADGNGIIGEIIIALGNANEKKPVSKKDIVEHLAGVYPKRSRDGMASTVSIQVPGRLANTRGLKISSKGEGREKKFWLVGGKDAAKQALSTKRTSGPKPAAKPAKKEPAKPVKKAAKSKK